MRREDMIHNKPPGLLMRIREMVFGVEDGLVSTTGAVVGIAAGAQDARVVILSGVVLVIVEALSMAAGTHLSAKSERQLIQRRIREEEYEIEHHPEHERQELHDMYAARGFTAEEVDILVRRITADKKLWLEEMVAKELRIGAEQLDADGAAAAWIMWVSYTIGGVIPVLPFLFLPVGTASLVAFVAALCALFGIGAWKAKVTGTSVFKGGMEMVLIAASAGLLGYVFGRIVGDLTGITPPV